MKLVQFLILAILASSMAMAIGVSPPTAEINFQPGATGEFDVLIMNSRDIPIDTTVEISGAYEEAFTATNPHVGKRGRSVATISFTLPDDIRPGKHRHKITFEEQFAQENAGGIAAKTAVTMFVYIWKPYPGQYGAIRLDAEHVKEGEDTQINVILNSRGTDTINGDVTINILDQEETLVDKIVMESIQVEGNSEFNRFVPVESAAFKPGKYKLDANYDYGAGRAETESSLIIGQETLFIVEATEVYYKDAGINKFQVVLESLWNEPLTGVTANLQLGEKVGQTPSITLAPFESKGMIGYWEVDEALEEGTHNALVTATFNEGDPVTKVFEVQVYNVTPKPQQEEPVSTTVVLGLADLVFIVIAILLFGYLLIHVWRSHHKR